VQEMTAISVFLDSAYDVSSVSHRLVNERVIVGLSLAQLAG